VIKGGSVGVVGPFDAFARHTRSVEFVPSTAIHHDLLAARGKNERYVAHNDQAAHHIDLKHTPFDVTARASVFIFAYIVSERGEDIFFDT
jgi:hypothetical protein